MNLNSDMGITSLSDADLLAEIERRKIPATPAPTALAQPDFTVLIETVTEGVNRTVADGYEDEDLQHYIYEAAVNAIYGPSYWIWRRAQKW